MNETKFNYLKIKHENGYHQYFRLGDNYVPEIFQYTVVEANKLAYDERVVARPDMSNETKAALLKVFPH